MTEKVKISKEAAESLRLVKEELWTNGDHWKLVRDHVLSKANFRTDDLDPLNSLSLDTLIRALYIGYDVEKTPEDHIKNYFNHYQEDEPYHRGYRQAVRDCMSILKIEIEGVNE